MKSVGLLGGSFDPPHKGHKYISIEAKKLLQINEIWWLVTPQNPLKISEPATYQERITNCKEISKDKPILIKEIEKKINSKYTYQTLDYLLHHYTNIKFFWIMGADNLINFHKWKNSDLISSICNILVFDRDRYKAKSLKSLSFKKYNKKNLEFIKFKKVNISSSKIKKI